MPRIKFTIDPTAAVRDKSSRQRNLPNYRLLQGIKKPLRNIKYASAEALLADLAEDKKKEAATAKRKSAAQRQAAAKAVSVQPAATAQPQGVEREVFVSDLEILTRIRDSLKVLKQSHLDMAAEAAEEKTKSDAASSTASDLSSVSEDVVMTPLVSSGSSSMFNQTQYDIGSKEKKSEALGFHKRLSLGMR